MSNIQESHRSGFRTKPHLLKSYPGPDKLPASHRHPHSSCALRSSFIEDPASTSVVLMVVTVEDILDRLIGDVHDSLKHQYGRNGGKGLYYGRG